MIVSLTAFLIDYPEFKETDPLLIIRKLSCAEDRTPDEIWGNNQRQGIMLLAAHFLVNSPIGEQARIDDKDKTKSNVYEQERKKLEQIVVCGLGRNT